MVQRQVRQLVVELAVRMAAVVAVRMVVVVRKVVVAVRMLVDRMAEVLAQLR